MAYNEHKTGSQVNYGWNLTWNATGKFPIIAKRIWKTLADLQAWVDDAADTAIEGLIVSVYADSTATNNGIYFVQSVGDGTNAGVLVKQADQSLVDASIEGKVDKAEGMGLSSNDYTDDEKAKLAAIAAGAQVNVIETVMMNGSAVAVSGKTVDLGNLQKALTAGSGIAIDEDGIISATLDVEAFKVVSELPESPEAGNAGKIHVVPNADGSAGDVYNEYLWDGSRWELLGSFKAEVDLGDYAKTADVNAAVEAVSATVAANKVITDKTQEDLDVLEATVEANKAVADKTQEDLDTLEATVEANKAVADKTQEDLDALEAAVEANKAVADKTQEDLDTLEAAVEANKAVADKTQEDLDALEAAVEANKAVADKTQEDLDTLEATVAGNSSKLEGIAEGATAVSTSYDAETFTLAINIASAE